jgi:hypothetical protein
MPKINISHLHLTAPWQRKLSPQQEKWKREREGRGDVREGGTAQLVGKGLVKGLSVCVVLC